MSTEATIQDKLTQAFSPVYLDVVNESYMHSVPPGSESHFKVTIVSGHFANQRSVKRHQQVYGQLADELKNGLHALALHTYTPEEWQGVSPASPQCLGGSKKES